MGHGVNLLVNRQYCAKTLGFLINELPESMWVPGKNHGERGQLRDRNVRNRIESAEAVRWADEKQFFGGKPPCGQMSQGAQVMEDAKVHLSCIEPATNLPRECLNQAERNLRGVAPEGLHQGDSGEFADRVGHSQDH